jgi:hypothetical protein
MSDSIEAIDWDAEAPVAAEDRERFRIQNDDQAVWAMRKLSAASKRIQEIKHIADSEIERIQSWAEQQSREPLRDSDYFEAILIEYGRGQRIEGRKSVSTPYGTIKSRTAPPAFEVDKDAFLEWAKANRPDLVRVKEEPNVADMKAVLEVSGDNAIDPESGEVVPGVKVTGHDVRFSVEVSK